MRIKYTGIHRRELGGYIWNDDNDRVVDVTDPELITSLPANQFVVALDDPLLQLVGPEHMDGLILAGIISPESLTNLKSDDLKIVAVESGIAESQLKSWIKKIKSGSEPQEE